MPLNAQEEKSLGSPARPAFFFEGVDFKKWLGVSFALGLLSASLLVASEWNIFPDRAFSLYDFLQNFSAYTGSTLMGFIFAEKSAMEIRLFDRPVSWRVKLGSLLAYGVLAGFVMGLTYHRVFLASRFSSHVPFRVRHMRSWQDSFILSLSAAVTEELVFRLLFFSAFFYVLSRLFRPVMSIHPALSQSIPFLFSLLFSAMLFGVVHGTYGFLFAFVGGIALSLIFLKGGLESAILAHFVTDVVFFQLTYLK